MLETADDEDEAAETTESTDEEEAEDGRMGITHFIDDMVLTFSANEMVEIESQLIDKGQDYALFNADLLKPGITTVSLQGGGFTNSFELNNLSAEQSTLHMVYPDVLSTGTKKILQQYKFWIIKEHQFMPKKMLLLI